MTFGLPLRLLAAGALCLLALVGLVIVEGRARASGTEVILAMRPVDPRSILSGHYVQLSFAEPTDQPCPAVDDDNGKDLWIALKRTDTHHVVTGAKASRADAEALGDVVMRGRYSCNDPSPAGEGFEGSPGEVRVNIAVERFHADQDEAVAIETAMRDRPDGTEVRVYAVLSVDAAGTPRTKGVIVDGDRVELTWF